MSAYMPNRRDFLKLATASSYVPFLSHLAWGAQIETETERTRWYRDTKYGLFHPWGAVLTGWCGSVMVDHEAEARGNPAAQAF